MVEHPMSPHALAAPLHRHTPEDEYSYMLEGRMGALHPLQTATAWSSCDGGPGDPSRSRTAEASSPENVLKKGAAVRNPPCGNRRRVMS